MLSGWSFHMFGKLAHVRSRGDVVLASLLITAVSVALAVVLTALATASLNLDLRLNAVRVAAEVGAVVAFGVSYAVVDSIRRILKAKRSIERLAMTDDLTGLPNRRAFVAAAEQAIERMAAGEAAQALLIVDLDHFKRVNDVYGHGAGDHALQAAAQALVRSVRADVDWVGRLGGEEFVVLIAGADDKTADRAAESARTAIATLLVAMPVGEIALTASIGMTSLIVGDSVASALQRADEALYAAKRAGRNQVASLAALADNSVLKEGQVRRRRDAAERWRYSA
jgi:diguanylate cyclase (GGDEF)-like protein